MSRPIDITGIRYGQLTPLSVRTIKGIRVWLCQCDCGKQKEIRQGDIRHGSTKSCGCSHVTHGMTRGSVRPSEYTVWTMMKARCSGDPKLRQNSGYADRGIRVCEQWVDSFSDFWNYVGPRPSPKHTLDRIDNNKGYEPGNVRWATPIEQGSNRRNNVRVEYKGEILTVAEAARRSGVAADRIYGRVRRGRPAFNKEEIS